MHVLHFFSFRFTWSRNFLLQAGYHACLLISYVFPSCLKPTCALYFLEEIHMFFMLDFVMPYIKHSQIFALILEVTEVMFYA